VPPARGLGIVIADLNDDGWPDVYVANDKNPNYLFQNLGPGESRELNFSEVGLASGTGLGAEGSTRAGMGIACADLDGDGRPDLGVTNFYREGMTLYLNQGELLFVDATQRAGLADATRPMLGFGVQAIDLDLDGRLDLFTTNGHVYDLSRPE